MRPRRLVHLAAVATLALAVGSVGSVPPASAAVPVTVAAGSMDVYDTDDEYVDTISFTGPSCGTPYAEMDWDTTLFGLTAELDRRASFGGDPFRMVMSLYVGGLHTSPAVWGWGTVAIEATPVTPGTCTPVLGAGVCEVEISLFPSVSGELSATMLTIVDDTVRGTVSVVGAPADCGDLALVDFGRLDPFSIIALI